MTTLGSSLSDILMEDDIMPNRYVCDTLKEMRDSLSKLNHVSLWRYKRLQASLIEEAQTMVNRMEEALYDQRDLKWVKQELKEKKQELKKLKKEVDNAKENSSG